MMATPPPDPKLIGDPFKGLHFSTFTDTQEGQKFWFDDFCIYPDINKSCLFKNVCLQDKLIALA
jgi:hypothetical protein